jgi:hypothetical protein
VFIRYFWQGNDQNIQSCTVFIRYFWLGNAQVYGHIRCIWTFWPTLGIGSLPIPSCVHTFEVTLALWKSHKLIQCYCWSYASSFNVKLNPCFVQVTQAHSMFLSMQRARWSATGTLTGEREVGFTCICVDYCVYARTCVCVCVAVVAQPRCYWCYL